MSKETPNMKGGGKYNYYETYINNKKTYLELISHIDT